MLPDWDNWGFTDSELGSLTSSKIKYTINYTCSYDLNSKIIKYVPSILISLDWQELILSVIIAVPFTSITSSSFWLPTVVFWSVVPDIISSFRCKKSLQSNQANG